MLYSRKHETDLDFNGNPAPARTSTLSGYRSAWAYYIWNQTVSEDDLVGIPGAWTAAMRDFFKGLKNNEAKRKQKGLLKCTQGKSKMCVNLFRSTIDYSTGCWLFRN